jgi:predicted ATPase
MDLICRFVLKNGENFGESIDEYGDYLIVKVSADFLAIPKKCIEKVDGEGIYISDFDEEEAKEIGRKWVEEKSKPVSVEELKSYGFGEE